MSERKQVPARGRARHSKGGARVLLGLALAAVAGLYAAVRRGL